MIKHTLNFKRPSGTSRGVLTSKETFFLVIEQEGKKGIGECNLFRGLSADDVPNYEAKLQWVEQHLHLGNTLFECLRLIQYRDGALSGLRDRFGKF